MNMELARNIGIIADDITGACDVAACFISAFGSVEVLVSKYLKSSLRSTATVINTQSRLKNPDECRVILKNVGLFLKEKSIIFKKIDAALRGPVGAELEGLHDSLRDREIILAPAIPCIGRITKGGIQFDNGIPIAETVYAMDPVSPVRSSKIADIVKETGNVACTIHDAETDEDLCQIVRVGLKNKNIIFAGSLGLANALAGIIAEKKLEQTRRPECRAKRVIIVSGSHYERTHQQIEKAMEHYGIRLIDIDPNEEHNARGRSFTLDAICDDEIVIIRLVSDSFQHQDIQPFQLFARFLSKAHNLIIRLKPDAIGIIGGETAFALFNLLNVNRLQVQGRISDVMPCGIIVDGKLAKCLFFTKGGSVGADDAVIRMIRFFRGE